VETWEAYQALSDFEKQSAQYLWANGAMNKIGSYYGLPEPATSTVPATVPVEEYQKVYADAAQWYTARFDEQGETIRTQEDAQEALGALNNAIVSKDKIRANLGAMQNRLENTITNLEIQAENLQASESRISDMDVATEMTQFVKEQILTQAATAMLTQANSLPQMALQLISG
jgi:flagellin